ncbi:putative methyltransferase NSUN7 [Conger conger]|uniref:putative methyltransferase NSUN7 n=1 Tax=Conger conger TaxID=82655 RepID=UPI002A5A1E49|nr:putative methyltransferase NSUN7 [Conger conger]
MSEGTQTCQTKKLMIQRPKDPVGPQINDVGFADHVYIQAAAIFQNSHVEKPEDQKLVDYGKKGNIWMPEERDEESCLLAYELAFNSLKYQDLLESIIACCMVISYSVPEDLMSLVVVMLFDFQDRKFVKRRRLQREKLPDVFTVEDCLFRFKTKLAASLARIRIKFNLLNIEYVLPEIVKQRQKRAKSLLLYAWVNTQKTSLEDVKGSLTSEGFSEASSDKPCSLPVNAARTVLSQDTCVLMTGCFSALTVAHMAAVASTCSANVLVCESREARRKELRNVLLKMACTNVEVIPRNFLDLDPMEDELVRVSVILMMPQCSLSAVSNPVEFIATEKRDMDLLQDLSRGSISQGRLNNLVACQKQEIKHALKVPKSTALVYSTWSSYSEENEKVVQMAVGSKSQIYRLSATGLALGSQDNLEDTKDIFVLEASAESNGGFVSVMTRVGASVTTPGIPQTPTTAPSINKAQSQKPAGKRKKRR